MTPERIAELRALCDAMQVAPTPPTRERFIAAASAALPEALDEIAAMTARLGRAMAVLRMVRSHGMPRGSTLSEQGAIDAILADHESNAAGEAIATRVPLLEAIAARAVTWWQGKRPLAWSESRTRLTPP